MILMIGGDGNRDVCQNIGEFEFEKSFVKEFCELHNLFREVQLGNRKFYSIVPTRSFFGFSLKLLDNLA